MRLDEIYKCFLHYFIINNKLSFFNLLRRSENRFLLNWILDKTNFLNNKGEYSLSTRCCLVLLGYNNFPRCKNCGKEIVKFQANYLNYVYDKNKSAVKQFCCKKCSSSYEETKINLRKTCLEKYGVHYSLGSEEIKRKAKQTKLKKYGDEKYVNWKQSVQTKFKKNNGKYISEDTLKKMQENWNEKKRTHEDKKIRHKIEQTCLQRYGTKCPLQSNIIKEKAKETIKRNIENDANYFIKILKKKKKTNLRIHGDENYVNKEKILQTHKQFSEDKKQKIRTKYLNTNKERHGDQNYNNRDKFRQTCNEKYGVDSPLKSQEVIDKIKDTVLSKYGSDKISQVKEIVNKIKNTNNKKYGCDYPFQSNEVQNKILNVIQKKYGVKTYLKLVSPTKYNYNDIIFDSKPEIAYYIWLTDNNIKFIYKPKTYI